MHLETHAEKKTAECTFLHFAAYPDPEMVKISSKKFPCGHQTALTYLNHLITKSGETSLPDKSTG